MGTDDYHIRSARLSGRDVLFLVGGRPLAALYAVYRYFECYSGCRWFWDGDRIHSHELTLEGIDLCESPRFEYRGLRYFAHRSLHRFQAEHWSLEDWKHEIDWILKKRLNLFMLRIGHDDVFQRAFPDIVRYPDRDKPLPEAGEGFDDRTLFWSLEFRGELRRQLLAYAFERDLIHPEDCGTMTHWYSRTPMDYLNAKKPKLLSNQSNGRYSQQTGLVWDIRIDENLNDYFKITDTYVKEYGRPDMFHTIGLAERKFSDDRETNRRLKFNVYRRIAAYLKEQYPNSPLLIASWDLWMHYSPEEVRKLTAELDPRQAILFDYTSDTISKRNFTNWGVVGKFPWIFGIFSGFEPNSEIRGNYHLTNERIRIAKADEKCIGVVLWPELSHGDTLITEYLARNAWNSDTMELDTFTDTYCRDRYAPTLYAAMSQLWRDFMPIVELANWNTSFGSDVFMLLFTRAGFDKCTDTYSAILEKTALTGKKASEILRTLALLPTEDEQLRRDIYDIARTILGRFTEGAVRRAEQLYAQRKDPAPAMESALALNRLLAGLLSTHEDYSMLATLEKLQTVTDTNPNFEITLKRNAECNYCRSYIFELAQYLYVPEMEILFDAVKKSDFGGIDRAAVSERISQNRERFFGMPLALMHKIHKPALSQVLNQAAAIIDALKLTD